MLLLVLAATGTGGLFGVAVPLWAVLFAGGLALPNAPALALSRHGDAAGTAAALLGAVQFGVGRRRLAAGRAARQRRGRHGHGDRRRRWCWRSPSSWSSSGRGSWPTRRTCRSPSTDGGAQPITTGAVVPTCSSRVTPVLGLVTCSSSQNT